MNKKTILRVVSWLLVFALVSAYLPTNVLEISADTSGTTTKVWNVSKLQAGTISENTTYGDFELKVSGKTLTIDGSEKTSDKNHSFTQRLKTGGAGTSSHRALYFTTTAEAKVSIYALSSSDTTDRTLSIYNAEGTKVVEGLTAYGAKNITDADGKIPAAEATLSEAGTYYICPDANVNIYYVSVTEGEAQSVDFSDGTTPSIESISYNAEDKNTLDVEVAGTIANADTDAVWVKMYSSAGELVDQEKIYEFTDGKKTVTLSPTLGAADTYTFVCEAIRDGSLTTYKPTTTESFDFKPSLANLSISSALTNKDLGLDVTWTAAIAAQKYTLSIAEKGSEAFTVLASDLTQCTYTIPNTVVTAGKAYTLKVEAFDAESNSIDTTMDKRVQLMEERFKTALVGSGAGGSITVDEETGIIEMNVLPSGSNSGGKLAESEDGFLYYYTEIDPTKENFELTATFTVTDGGARDNQSGFGVMAIDTFKDGDSASRYFNSAASVVRKYTNRETGLSQGGIPGGYFVTGYTEAPSTSSSARKTIDTSAFDWSKTAFTTGDVYTLTLKKDNTGFHAIMDGYDEVICYEPELLLKQDSSKYYVGVCAARKIKVEVSNMRFTTSDPATDPEGIPRPVTTKYASVSYDSASTAGTETFETAFKADYVGTVNVYDAENNLVAENLAINPSEAATLRVTANVTLKEGKNDFKAIFTPGTNEQQGSLLGNSEVLDQTPIEVKFSVSYKKYGTSENAIYVSASGSANNKGTKASPLDIYTAVDYAQPGQEIVLLGGTYKLTKKVEIQRGHNGTKENPITIMSAPGEKVKFDLANSSSGGFILNGNYWHLYDFEVFNGQANQKVVQVSGHYNTVEKLAVHNNGYTGIQISGSSAEPFSMWPSNNLILSCESYNNCDPLANDADGFAAKITCGEGNVFRYCISHHNIDDGWDLYAKSTTGVIGEVLVDQCVAYNNGYLTADSGNTIQGEGNGFKLGGESMPVAHKLVNSIAFDNLASGVFSNSNPSCIIENTTSYQNGGRNLQLNTNASTTTWVLNNHISYGTAGDADSMALKNQSSLLSETNYIDGTNLTGASVADDWFVSLDTTLVPTIAEDGSIDMHGLLQLTDSAANGIGGVISTNANPTEIAIGSEIEDKVEDEVEEPEVTPSPEPSEETSVEKPVITVDLDASKTYTYVVNAKTHTLKVSAKGTNVTYQWYWNTTNKYSGATKIKGATSNTYTLPSKTVSTRYYFCKVTAHDETKDIKTAAVNSAKVKVTVRAITKPSKPVIKTNLPKGSNGSIKTYKYNVGSKTTTLKVSATGKKISYQWYSNTKNSTAGAKKISGATKASYTPSSKAKGTKYYFCKITNTDTSKDIKTCTVSSRIVKVVVKVPVKSIKCDDITIKAGKSKALKVTVAPSNATNKNVTYKSSNPKYATVSKAGVVTGKKLGKGKTVTITITSKDNSKVVKKVKVKIQ